MARPAEAQGRGAHGAGAGREKLGLVETRRAELVEAFERTFYWVEGPDGRFALRVEERSPELEALLRREGASRWVYLTAVNPAARLQGQADNDRTSRELRAELYARGLVFFEGESVAERGDWPSEPSLLVLELDEDEARALGRRFSQAAVLVGELGGAPRLVWL